MKKILALILAVAMLAAGNVAALAADYIGPTVTIPDEYRYLTMNVGETLTIKLEVMIPDKEYHVDWSSSNEEVATVDQNGKVTALAPGKTTITALNDGYGPWSEITVYDDDTYVFLSRKNPGELSRYSWSINCDDTYWANFILEKQGPDEVTSVTSKNNGKIRLETRKAESSNPNEQKYTVYYQLSSLEFGLDDLNKEMEDSILVTLKSGKTYEFPLVWVLTAYPYLSAHPTDPEEIVLAPGETATIHYQVIDKQEWVTSYEPAISLTDEGDVALGEIVKDGDQFSVTVTYTGKDVYTYVMANISVQVKNEYDHYTGYYWSLLEKDVLVKGEYHSNKPDEPTTPDTDPDSKASEPSKDSDQAVNKAAEDAAVDVLQETNAALASGKELPSKAQTVTTAAGTAITAVPVKLYGLDASLSMDTMELLADSRVGIDITLNSGRAEVILPGGFQLVPEPGRFGYPLGFQSDPRDTDLMKEAVKGEEVKTEVYKLGGNVTFPTTATVILKTKLAGKINVYHWNEDTHKATLVASPTAGDGSVTFATKQFGNFILTTGSI